MLVGWMVVYLISFVMLFEYQYFSDVRVQVPGLQFLLASLLVLAHGRVRLGQHSYCLG